MNRNAVRRFFGRDGMLATKHPGFELRKGQMDMAAAVEEALTENRKLIVEAGTGTGKTLAYLVPALQSGRRVVISTGTKALQEQLYFRDIPFLESVLERPLRVCYMKGRSNYACRQKIYEAEGTPMLSGLEEVADFQIIQEWEKQPNPATGRRSGRCRRTVRHGRRSMHGRNCARDRSARSTSDASSR